MPFKIEPASSADAHEVALLLRRSIIELCSADHGESADRYRAWIESKTPENVEKWITAPGVFLAATDHTRRVLGVAAGRPDGQVLLNYVLPDVRLTGVSKALMRALEDYYRDRGLDEVRLTSTRTAEQFYRSLRYLETDELDTRVDMTFRGFREVL